MLLERLFYGWRICATGLGFCVMGMGGLLLVVAVFPFIALATADTSRRADRVQRAVHLAFRAYVLLLRGLGVIRFEVVGRQRLAPCRGVLVVANHPTLLDVVLLMALIPQARCVVKHQLWRNPFLGGAVRAAGYIRNDQEPGDVIEQCRAALAGGNNLIIFPEGTRSVPGSALRFQRGFANIALLAEAEILPLRISCEPITLTKGSRWYQVPARRASFRVTVEERFSSMPFLAHGGRALGARRLVAFLENHYRDQELYERA